MLSVALLLHNPTLHQQCFQLSHAAVSRGKAPINQLYTTCPAPNVRLIQWLIGGKQEVRRLIFLVISSCWRPKNWEKESEYWTESHCLLHSSVLIYSWYTGYTIKKYLFNSSTYSQEYLQWGVSHLYELKIHQTARYRYIPVVLRCPGRRRSDGCHPAPRAIFHPPGAMHGQIERQDKVRVLARQRGRDTQKVSWVTSTGRRQIRKQADRRGRF